MEIRLMLERDTEDLVVAGDVYHDWEGDATIPNGVNNFIAIGDIIIEDMSGKQRDDINFTDEEWDQIEDRLIQTYLKEEYGYEAF